MQTGDEPGPVGDQRAEDGDGQGTAEPGAAFSAPPATPARSAGTLSSSSAVSAFTVPSSTAAGAVRAPEVLCGGGPAAPTRSDAGEADVDKG